MKVFISYKRGESDDELLAQALVESLISVHEVFIDKSMRTGIDWVDEIDRRIQWCDFLVVLLSRSALDSEMVKGEIRRAHHQKKRILPVRINYFDSLDYELDSYLARIQYSKWEGSEDTEKVVSEISGVLDGDETLTGFITPGVIGPEDIKNLFDSRENIKPRPSIDPRSYVASFNAVPLDDPFYLTRDVDETVAQSAKLTGQTVFIKGANQIGKSSLLMRYLLACRDEGKRSVFLDFALLSDELDDMGSLLTAIAEQIAADLELDLEKSDVAISNARNFDLFMRKKVLSDVTEQLVLAFDDVDHVIGKSYQTDFFRMLRSWSDSRAHRPESWGRVGLALAISTEPSRLIEGGASSPFNVATPIEPAPFGLTHIKELNQRLNAGLDEAIVTSLFDLTGGHPYLTRLAFYKLIGPQNISFNTLLDQAAEDDGPFSDHLRAQLFKLSGNGRGNLRRSLKHIIANQSKPDEDSFDWLRAIGLVRVETGGRVVPANLLYARFFGRQLD